MSKSKVLPCIKIDAIQRIKDGIESIRGAARRLGVRPASVQQWISIYNSDGVDGFQAVCNKKYPKELKERAVLDYLAGKGSQQSICQRYGIRSKGKFQIWIKKYNGHDELISRGTGGFKIMTKGRKTTFEERIEIVQYCIARDHNYAETSEKFQVSYQQARSYTVKFEAGGIEALQDRRGHRKQADELTEIERLRAENKILRTQKERAEMEVSFLKKLSEIERGRD